MISVCLHIAAIILIAILPADLLSPPPEPANAPRIVTPLIEPLTEFTQPNPNKGKLNKEIDMASLLPRDRIQAPKAAPSTTRPMAQRPAPIPTPPQPAPAALPEPPKLEAVVKEPPKIELPPHQFRRSAPAAHGGEAQDRAGERRRAPAPGRPGPAQDRDSQYVGRRRHSPVDARRRAQRRRDDRRSRRIGAGGVGDGRSLPPSPGVQGSALELKSDPMGVDFRPYLTQILASIRRNWYAVMPESVKLGRRGKVGLLFAIVKSGNVSKVTFAFQSGTDSLDKAAIAAISASNPFPPLPPEFKGERVVLQLNFAYNVQK